MPKDRYGTYALPYEDRAFRLFQDETERRPQHGPIVRRQKIRYSKVEVRVCPNKETVMS
ncbi:hypothetical protein FE784_23375 [Paenibacillus hemerocallicola]|uniref:Uncharacterized protein n=1 Tax=Paenibacillus hemerocallicola TaxID=1172614 RepID=A0A5C4T524_9BACL|nr:hypothetical protein FE784_23375 [Paenibacillus hemerocallicola]